MASYDTALMTVYMTYLLQFQERPLIDVFYFMSEHPAFDNPVGPMDPNHFEFLYRRMQSLHKPVYLSIRAGRIDPPLRRRIDREWKQWQTPPSTGYALPSSYQGSSTCSSGSRSIASWDDGRSVASGSSQSTVRPHGRHPHSPGSLRLLNDAQERHAPRLITWEGSDWDDDYSVASRSSGGSRKSRSSRSSTSRGSKSRTLWDGQSRSSQSSGGTYYQ